jgi:uncharacterized membrane protein YhaH (DUF805 family)
MSLAQLLFSFRGRLNRKSYWMTVIVTMAIILLLLLLALIMIREQRFEFAVFTVIILLILYIPLIWIGLAIGAKRLHDRDKSAWWLLVFYALPGILSSAGNQMDDVAFLILHVVSFAITVWAFVELGCLRGTRGPNRFGPDPLSRPT